MGCRLLFLSNTLTPLSFVFSEHIDWDSAGIRLTSDYFWGIFNFEIVSIELPYQRYTLVGSVVLLMFLTCYSFLRYDPRLLVSYGHEAVGYLAQLLLVPVASTLPRVLFCDGASSYLLPDLACRGTEHLVLAAVVYVLALFYFWTATRVSVTSMADSMSNKPKFLYSTVDGAFASDDAGAGESERAPA